MAIVQQLSVLAVRALFEGFCRSIGFEAGAAAADAAVKFLGNRFTDHSARLSDALGRANENAWRALELSLAGDSWWDRVKVTLARREDQAFREQVGAFLRATPLAGLPGHPPEFRARALADLRAARKAGVLNAGGVDPQELARRAGPFARHADPAALLDAEWDAVAAVVETLRAANFSALAHFSALRAHGETPMLAVAVRYFFRRELESDSQLSTALSFAQMERLASSQEAGYDALASALSKNGERFEELMAGALALLTQTHAVVSETHGDVKQIKATLDVLGDAVFRAFTPGAPGGAPARKEADVRLEMLDALLTTPHRALDKVYPLHEQLIANDPRFYVRLAAWYAETGEVRDHKECFVVALCLSAFDGHRDVGLALLRQMPPYQVTRVVDFIHGRKVTRRKRVMTKKRTEVVREVTGTFGLGRALPRSLRTEVGRYLAEREANPEWFDSTVLTARKSLKRLYAMLHVRPGERAQRVLFDDDPPADSRLAIMRRLAAMTDPVEQAKEVHDARLPFRLASSLLGKLTAPTLAALVERMTPQEVINGMGMLKRNGALDHAEVRLMVELKLEEAKTATRVSTLKADRALEAVAVDDALRTKLEDVSDERIKAKGRLRRSTALFIDKSGSMETAIEVGRRLAAMISTACDKAPFVCAFDTMAYPIESAGTDWASWKKAFAGINANGETSVGSAVELLRRRKQVVEQIIVVTDEEEYNPPFFVESLLKYRRETRAHGESEIADGPAVCFVKVPDSSTRLEEQCKRAGIVHSTFQFSGDYYSLPNLVNLLEPPSQLDLLMQIMDHPLPARRA